jgi:single-strand DNA-binding protein
MSRSVNKAVLIGNLGADPEVRTTSAGTRVATFSLATGRRGGQGEPRERTDWHRVVVWDRLVDVVERHLRKGERVYVEGRLEHRSWQDTSGRTRYATEINAEELVLLSAERPAQDATRPPVPEPEPATKPWEKDDLPF